MRVMLKKSVMVVIPESEQERDLLGEWGPGQAGHVLLSRMNAAGALTLKDLGPVATATREPINVTSAARDTRVRLISNLAATPFALHGARYASIEGFWQGLKFPHDSDRRRIAALAGQRARHAGQAMPYEDTLIYQGATIRTGCWEHWQLMRAACQAKFEQHAEARAALLATGTQPLIHRVRHESRTIPGVIMAEIWMEIRRQLTDQSTTEANVARRTGD